MIQWILDTLVGDYNTKQLQQVQKIIPLIHDRYERFDDLSDDEIKAKTNEFKQRIKD
jgi:preprotein translocase subunit SecA